MQLGWVNKQYIPRGKSVKATIYPIIHIAINEKEYLIKFVVVGFHVTGSWVKVVKDFKG